MDAAIERMPRRFKSKSWPLGAARFRLFVTLRSLGFRRDAFEKRIRSKTEREAWDLETKIVEWISC